VSEDSSLRAADADRERLAAELREHMLAGRLTAEELEERLERTYAARTRGELGTIRADLPMGLATLEGALTQRKDRLRRRLVQEGGGALGVSAVCVGIWAASGADGSFWPVWVILATLLPLVRNSWRLLGPAPDLEAVEAHLNRRRARALARERRHARHRGLPR
jgi:hypothetical protein